VEKRCDTRSFSIAVQHEGLVLALEISLHYFLLSEFPFFLSCSIIIRSVRCTRVDISPACPKSLKQPTHATRIYSSLGPAIPALARQGREKQERNKRERDKRERDKHKRERNTVSIHAHAHIHTHTHTHTHIHIHTPREERLVLLALGQTQEP
jgi:hypothetical protein